MQPIMYKQKRRKLTLHRETLQILPEDGLKPAQGGGSGGGCTVLTTCSPDCCPSMQTGGTRIDDGGC